MVWTDYDIINVFKFGIWLGYAMASLVIIIVVFIYQAWQQRQMRRFIREHDLVSKLDRWEEAQRIESRAAWRRLLR